MENKPNSRNTTPALCSVPVRGKYVNAEEENSSLPPVATAIKGPYKIYTTVTSTQKCDFMDF